VSEPTYCERCATRLERKRSEGPDPDRLVCPSCGFVAYENPSPTVQAWIERDGRFLALKRGQDPERGSWNMPGGFVEAGESGPEAIRREVREETGLEIEILGVIGVFASTYGEGPDAEPIFDVAFRATTGDAELDVSDESEEARWFSLADFPEPAFRGEREALAILRGNAAATEG
jgi:ADP-ribose pyrophosphatase YjhB (NUDIX family)